MNALLPPNATKLERDLDRSTERLDGIAVDIGALWNAQRCPQAALPWLAWALSVDEWDDGWDEARKRQVAAASLGIHQRKGTKESVQAALEAAGYDARIIEHSELAGAWRDAGGKYLNGTLLLDGEDDLGDSVGTFPALTATWAEYIIELTALGNVTAEDLARIRRICELTAPARCDLVAIQINEGYRVLLQLKVATFNVDDGIHFGACRSPRFLTRATLDGCSTLAGTYSPDRLDGTDRLDGETTFDGLRPDGEPLSIGGAARWTLTEHPPDRLTFRGDTLTLDGDPVTFEGGIQ